MIGLLVIGLALVLGFTMRIAASAGVAMLVLMWSAVLPPANNPFMDDHIVYALVFVAIALAYAGQTWGLGRAYERRTLVRRYPRSADRHARRTGGRFAGFGNLPVSRVTRRRGKPRLRPGRQGRPSRQARGRRRCG
jgi:hypothetical protein